MGKASISRLRTRIGAAPLADLVQRCCVPLANEREHPEAFYAGLRLVAMDGSCFELPDEADNAAPFGYPGSRTSVAGTPATRRRGASVLVECATHAILGANIGPYRSGEWELAGRLLPRLAPGMLCLADRGFNGFEHWRQARPPARELLWRCSTRGSCRCSKLLDDGSFLSSISPIGVGRAQAAEQAITVRVIEYAMPGDDQALPRYRLLTTLLDPQAAPALELAALYHQRWEVEAVFDELKTHLRQGRRVLRSKTPELVRQEFYGWVLAHYAVRWLLHQGATDTDCRTPSCPSRDTSNCCAAHTAPIRGLSPQSGPDAGADGSVNCSHASAATRASEQRRGARRGWSPDQQDGSARPGSGSRYELHRSDDGTT